MFLHESVAPRLSPIPDFLLRVAHFRQTPSSLILLFVLTQLR